MTITDTYLEEIAKSMNGESYEIASHLGVGTTDVTAIQTDDTSLAGEIGNRLTLSGNRVDNQLEVSAVRPAASVQDTTDGDDLRSVGVFNQDTAGTLLSGVTMAGVTQSTNFDIEFIFEFTVDRK